MLAPFVPSLHGQQIQLKLMNARNGKPIRGECVNVWTGTGRDRHLVAETNNDGIAILQLGQGEILAETACKGWEPRGPVSPDSDALMLAPNWRVACQEYTKVILGEPISNPLTRMPAYPIKEILKSGVSAANTCGRFRQQAKPGELILFVRSRTFFEAMSQ
jgi:hypothetical protein